MRTLLMASAAAALVSGLGFSVPAAAQTGSYQASCRNVQNSNGTLSAQCSDGRGGYRSSSITSSQCRGDIGNNGGMLSCNGANATGGQSVSDNNRGNNNDRRSNNNDVAIAGAAGLVAGVALANNGRLYAPGYAYPAYGQSGYGDPRRDPRYAQGGYAYGHANGQWMPIAQRAQWLDQRINRGSQEGTLDRGDVHSLRQELTGLEQLENRYQRRGLQGWEMADLDKRFDALASRIQYERTDGDNGPNARRDYQNRYSR